MSTRRVLRSTRTRAAQALGGMLSAAVLLMATATAHADDGDPDASFSGDGQATFAWPTMFNGGDVIEIEAHGVTVLDDGSTLVLSNMQTLGPDRFEACVVTKFRRAGTLDMPFGNGGWAFANFRTERGKEECLGVFPAAGNTILVVGYIPSMGAPRSTPAFARLRADGSFDPGFGVGGQLVVPGHPFGASAGLRLEDALQAPDGKIVLVGWCDECGNGASREFVAARFHPTGALDASFGTGGWARFGRANLEEIALSGAIDSVGRLVLAGYSTDEDDSTTPQDVMLVRLLGNGQVDTTFNATGVVDIALIASMAASAVAIDTYNDSILVAANITNSPSIVPGALLLRVLRNGSVDSFGSGGAVTLQQEEGVNITRIAVRGDRRVVAAGWIDPNGTDTRDFFAARVTSTGALDPAFDSNGVARYPFTFAANSIDVPRAMTLSGSRPVIVGTLKNLPDETFATGVLRLQSDFIFRGRFDLGQ